MIDNESQNNFSDEINKSDKIHIIKNKNNEGFARANNQGIKYSLKNGFDYVLLLNNDTIIKNDLLDSLIKQSSTLNQKIIINQNDLTKNEFIFEKKVLGND